jgi:hypothetical protein
VSAPLTVVFVDVDGVINVDQPTWWPQETWRTGHVYFQQRGVALTVQWSTGVIDGLREIEALPGVEMRWLTTWRQQARYGLAPVIGVGDDWQVEDMLEWGELQLRPHLRWWKGDPVRGAVWAGARTVWIDDEISRWLDTAKQAGSDHEYEWMDPTLLLAVSPPARTGIEQDHIDAIKHFITTGERPAS